MIPSGLYSFREWASACYLCDREIKKSKDQAVLHPTRPPVAVTDLKDLSRQKLETLLQALLAVNLPSSSSSSFFFSFFFYFDRNSSCAVYIFKRCIASCTMITTLTALSASVHILDSATALENTHPTAERERDAGEAVKMGFSLWKRGVSCHVFSGVYVYMCRYRLGKMTDDVRRTDGKRRVFLDFLLSPRRWLWLPPPVRPSARPSVRPSAGKGKSVTKESRKKKESSESVHLGGVGEALTSFFPCDQFLISSFLFPRLHPSSHT